MKQITAISYRWTRPLCLVLFILLSGILAAQVQSTARMPRHPRLLLMRGGEKKMLRDVKRDSTWTDIHRSILNVANYYTDKKRQPVTYTVTGRRLLSVSREALRRILFLSYAYRTTHDDKYYVRAREELMTVAAFPDWHPSHFLDVGEMTLAVALGYDWLYNNLTQTERQTLAKAIEDKGLRPSLPNGGKEAWYITTDNNWGQVVHCGMVYGAIAIWEQTPQLAADIVNRAVKYVLRPMEAYAPDGAYPEGCGYWDYGTTFNVLLLDELRQVFGSDFKLTEAPGFMKTGQYITHMCTPALQWFAYSDNGNHAQCLTAPFWFYRETGDEAIIAQQQRILHRKETASLMSDRLAPCAVIWGHATRLDQRRQVKSLSWRGEGPNPVYVCRSGWGYEDAFMGMKLGAPIINHGHMDIGSFIYEQGGVMWAADLGGENYNNLEQAGMDIWNKSQGSGRWKVFRYHNLQHNTLTFNGHKQIVDGRADFTSTENSFPGSAEADLTAVYAQDAEHVVRRCALLGDGSMTVHDKIQTKAGKNTEMTWTMVTPAQVVQTGPAELRLSKGDQTVILSITGIAKPRISITPATPPQKFENQNEGFTIIRLVTTLQPSSTTELTATLKPMGI